LTIPESEATSTPYPRWVTILAGRGKEEYFLSLRTPFLICVLMYGASFVMGYMFSNRVTLGSLRDLLPQLPDLAEVGPLEFTVFLFVNNAISTFMWMLLGFIFGVGSLFFASFNGFTLGLIAHSFSQLVSPLLVFLSIAPHGIVELPTTLLSAAMGVKLGYTLLNRLRGHGSISAELARSLVLYFMRVLPLLFLAASIEAFITPVLVKLVG